MTKVTLPHLRELKLAGTPIVMVTAYDHPSARIVDAAGVDLVLDAAGCFAIVLECVREPVAAAISRRLTIPTIGIGSGAGTDGQVLVLHDLLDMRSGDGFLPRFVKQFAHIGDAMREGVSAYAAEVRGRTYPAVEHTYPIASEELSAFETAIEAGSAEDNVLS